MDRKTFLRSSLCCAVSCLALTSLPAASETANAGEPPTPEDPEKEKAKAVMAWLDPFVVREEKNLDRAALVKLLEERGQVCCRILDFRQKLIADAGGNVDKLVELMGKIVGPENSTRAGNTVTLVYPVAHCVCGRNPKRPPVPDDPYCECSKANNRRLFEIVSGRPVHVDVVESPRRGGNHCRFRIQLS